MSAQAIWAQAASGGSAAEASRMPFADELARASGAAFASRRDEEEEARAKREGEWDDQVAREIGRLKAECQRNAEIPFTKAAITVLCDGARQWPTLGERPPVTFSNHALGFGQTISQSAYLQKRLEAGLKGMGFATVSVQHKHISSTGWLVGRGSTGWLVGRDYLAVEVSWTLPDQRDAGVAKKQGREPIAAFEALFEP